MQAMVMVRFFSGSRNSSDKGGGKTASASGMMREQLRKGKKIDQAENYKKLLQQKLAEAKFRAATGEKKDFSMLGSGSAPVQRSKRSQDIIEIIAKRELAREQKKLKKAVVVEARKLSNGRIDEKGRVFDAAGNVVVRVNLKNGNMSTIYGQSIGRYIPKSYLTKMAIENAITKNSPYLINQRKMVEVQRQERLQEEHARAQNNSVWNAPQRDLWGNPIADFFGNFF
jgi:hypothetical protein